MACVRIFQAISTYIYRHLNRSSVFFLGMKQALYASRKLGKYNLNGVWQINTSITTHAWHVDTARAFNAACPPRFFTAAWSPPCSHHPFCYSLRRRDCCFHPTAVLGVEIKGAEGVPSSGPTISSCEGTKAGQPLCHH